MANGPVCGETKPILRVFGAAIAGADSPADAVAIPAAPAIFRKSLRVKLVFDMVSTPLVECAVLDIH